MTSSTATKTPELRAVGIEKRFGGLEVLRGISLDVEPGEVHALIGPNGAGKSTFFKIVSGELEPNAGEVEIFGSPTTNLAPHKLVRRGVGRAFQIPQVLEEMTVLESMVVSLEAVDRWGPHERHDGRWVGAVKGWTIDAATETLELLGLMHLAQRNVGELAHGDHKLVELAMAFAQRPRLLLLDEPTAGMSPSEVHRCIDVIRGVNVGQGVSILLTEHDMEAVFRLATRISVLAGGHLIATGGPDEIRNDEQVREAYLGRGH